MEAKFEKMKELVATFVGAARELNAFTLGEELMVINHIFKQEYPFAYSFDDIYMDIVKWQNAMEFEIEFLKWKSDTKVMKMEEFAELRHLDSRDIDAEPGNYLIVYNSTNWIEITKKGTFRTLVDYDLFESKNLIEVEKYLFTNI